MAAVLYTVLKTKEYPPEDLEAFEKMKAEGQGIGHIFKEIFTNIADMPNVMRQLAVVQFFTWMGLFLMWFYFTVTVANDIFNAASPQSPEYAEGIAWANICFGFYSAVTFLFSFFLPPIANRLGKKYTHALCLTIGGLGLLFVGYVPNEKWLLLSMFGVGIAWTSVLAMPYSILAPKLPADKIGIYMGIFNFFIVIPEIIATLFFGFIMLHVLDNDRVAAVMIGGGLLIVAAIASFFVDDSE